MLILFTNRYLLINLEGFFVRSLYCGAPHLWGAPFYGGSSFGCPALNPWLVTCLRICLQCSVSVQGYSVARSQSAAGARSKSPRRSLSPPSDRDAAWRYTGAASADTLPATTTAALYRR